MNIRFGRELNLRPCSLLLSGLLLFFITLFTLQLTTASEAHAAEYELVYKDKVTIEVKNITLGASDWGSLPSNLREAYGGGDTYDSAVLEKINNDINSQAQGEYKDGKIDADWDHTLSSGGCTSRISDDNGDRLPDRTLVFKEIEVQPPGQGCIDITGGGSWEIPESSVDYTNFAVYLVYTDKDTIVRVDGKVGPFERDPRTPNRFYRTSEQGQACQDYVEITEEGNDFDKAQYNELDTDPPDSDQASKISDTCWRYTNRNRYMITQIKSSGGFESYFPVGLVVNRDDDPNNDVSAGEAADGSGVGGDSENTCEESGASLAWILCQVFNGVQELTTWLYETIIEPFLYTPPVSTDPNSPSFQAWSSFRVVGNVFLVIAMLVIVFGQSLGGGLIDAYTAKKILPRILAAAILINLSVYIIAVAVDVSNVVGRGIGQLILAPFEASGVLDFGLNNTQGIGIVGLTGLGAWLGSGALAAALFSGSLGSIAVYIGLAVFLPAMLALIGVFVTLVLRRGLILFLVLVSPIAFALYCLPNTEKYFSKWWELMFKALLMYPIVAVVFAISDVLAGTIVNANNANAVGGVENVLAVVIAFALQIIPLFMIPYSFKLAGGALGAIHGAVSGGSGKITEAFGKKKEIQKEKADVAMLRGRSRVNARGETWGKSSSRFKRMGGRVLTSGTIAGYNIHEDDAAQNAFWTEKINKIKASGKDDRIRALTAIESSRFTDTDGVVKYKTLAGGTVTEDDRRHAQRIFGKNKHAFQAALSYEMTKVNGQASNDSMLNNYASVASNFGLSDDERDGVWIGSAFANQDKNLQYKYTKYDANGNARIDGKGLLTEIDEKRGSWAMGQQDADTWTTMSQEVSRARQVIASGQADGDMDVAAAQEVIERGARVARQYKTSGGQVLNEDGQVVASSGSAGAPGRVAEEIENFQALFNTTEGGQTSNYTREYGTERRDDPGRRSGDQPPATYDQPGVGPPVYGPPSPPVRNVPPSNVPPTRLPKDKNV